jgi:hypothetical protein
MLLHGIAVKEKRASDLVPVEHLEQQRRSIHQPFLEWRETADVGLAIHAEYNPLS